MTLDHHVPHPPVPDRPTPHRTSDVARVRQGTWGGIGP